MAVKSKQVAAVKTLIWDLNANAQAQNEMGMTPIDYCNKFVKDEATRVTMMGLLTKMHQNIKVQKNLAQKKAREQQRQKKADETLALKS